MIAPGFGSTRHFPKEWNNSVYFQLRKMPCGFKDQARFCPSGEKCGLVLTEKVPDLDAKAEFGKI
jgi:hypothetical protein